MLKLCMFCTSVQIPLRNTVVHFNKTTWILYQDRRPVRAIHCLEPHTSKEGEGQACGKFVSLIYSSQPCPKGP